VGEKAAGA